MDDTIRVLVFGSAGVGKTSLCNALTNGKEPVGDSVVGVTFSSHEYPAVSLFEKTLQLTDTAGLNEAKGGNVSAAESVRQLISLLRKSKKGYNLMIHVTNSSRLQASDQSNYDLFVKVIANLSIPTIRVVTKCDGYNPLSKNNLIWKEQYADLGMNYNGVFGTTFTVYDDPEMDKVMVKKRQESVNIMTDAILKHAAPNSITIYDSEDGFWVTLKRAWNGFAKIFNLPIFNLSKDIIEVLRDIGLSIQEARDFVKEQYSGKS